MHLYPTTNAVHVAAASLVVVGAGLVTAEPAILAWGGALLVGLAIARAATFLGVARVRSAGFEMLWREEARTRRVCRGETVDLAGEVRNRDSLAARYVSLRAVASPDLTVEISPDSGEVPASGRLAVSIRVTARRVGRHALHGLSLEVRGGPGLFEVPLTFANPFGIEVVPATYGAILHTARGGRSRTAAQSGRSGPISGDGYELREIREHRAGDALKRVAWKASARRGKLLVRDYEQEERDVVWLVVDASVELWSGTPGLSPLDHAIDEAMAVAEAHLSRGDHVGLFVCGTRVLARVPAARGPAQAGQIALALITATGALDADRSGLDPGDVAARVMEHLRPLDPLAIVGISAGDREELVRRAALAAARAPFPSLAAHADDPTDRALRGYLSAFGIPSPPRLEPERQRTDQTLARVLSGLGEERPRPSLAYVWSPAPDPVKRPVLFEALSRHSRRRLDLRWMRMKLAESVPAGETDTARAVAAAVTLRAQATETIGERALRRLGVKVERFRARVPLRPDVPGRPDEPPARRP